MAYEPDDPYNQSPPSPGRPPSSAPTGMEWYWDETTGTYQLRVKVLGEATIDGQTYKEVARVYATSDADAMVKCSQHSGPNGEKTQPKKLNDTTYSCVISAAPASTTTTPSTDTKPADRGPRPASVAPPSGPREQIWWTYPQSGGTRIIRSVVGSGGFSDYLNKKAEQQ